MFEPQPCTPSPESERRRGIILLVVLALLTLFAIVGLSFVLYADAEASSSRIFREAPYPRFGQVTASWNPYYPWNYALAQLIFPVDDVGGVYSALRGHDLARDMYGWNYDTTGGGSGWSGSTTPNGLHNIYPFNGTGRLHYQSNWPDDFPFVNYTYYPADGFLRDPERLNNPLRTNTGATPGPYTGGFNSSYTYPDLNHMFLAAVKADGTVMMPSFYRPTYFDPTGLGLNNSGNTNWTSAQGKYMILRPRPAENPGFPYPAGPMGDVQNLPNPKGDSDSIWMDLGYPEAIGPGGIKYKPLFAWLVIDLDNKVNLNAVGNIRGAAAQPHVSNPGWGRWETSLAQVLTQNGTEWTNLFSGNGKVAGRYGPDGTPGTKGNSGPYGTLAHVYAQGDWDSCNDGQGGVPTGRIVLPAGANCFPTFPAGYSNGGSIEQLNHPLLYNVMQSPTSSTPGPYPVYTASGTVNNDDRIFPTSDMGKILPSYLTPTSTALSSTPGQLCPTNFGNTRICGMVTTDSWDVDRPACTPWIYDRTQAPTAVSKTPGPDQGPPTQSAGVAFPAVGQRTGAFPAYGNTEFGSPSIGGSPVWDVDWRMFPQTITAMETTLNPPTTNQPPTVQVPPAIAIQSPLVSSVLSRVDLNRFLPPYPHMGAGLTPSTYSSTPMTPWNQQAPPRFDAFGPQVTQQFQAAQAARQMLADDIYRRLLIATGVPNPSNPGSPDPVVDLMPRRWLAQLAVNIVDFIDEDDISTPFNFYTSVDAQAASGFNANDVSSGNSELLKYWVFGTELPRVVVNEAMAEYQTPTMSGNLTVNVFAELFNPLPTTGGVNNTQSLDAQGVPLYVPKNGGSTDYSAYEIVIADNNASSPNGLLARPAGYNDNVLGTPDQVRATTTFTSQVYTTDKMTMPLGNPWIAPQSYFLVGPGADARNSISTRAPAGTNFFKPLVAPSSMSYQVTFTLPNTWSPDDRTNGLAVLLRRLANPYMPPNVPGQTAPQPYDSTQALNPYVTTDYIQQVALNDATNAGNVYYSQGKKQPYTSDPSQVGNQSSPAGGAPPPGNNTKHTFGQANDNAATNFDWLVHLDRQVISPFELFQVSGYHPYQLTHQFINSAGKFQQLVPWSDQTNRLYRIFDFLEAHDRAAGTQQGGRIPGRININTIWDPEIFNALCDPQPSNYFTAGDVANVWTNLLAQRSAALGGTGASDQPFLGTGIGYSPGTNDPLYPGGSGINNTILRSATAGGAAGTPRFFQVPGGGTNHPYFQNELLTKIANNMTTRSNAFACWLTISFFQVTNDTQQPYQLGAEIGAQYRRQLFCIIDRTQLHISLGDNPAYLTVVNTQITGPFPQQAFVKFTGGLAGSANTPGGSTIPWSIQAGTVLTVDSGLNQETIVVNQVVPALNGFYATFTKAHVPPPGQTQGWVYPVMMAGNPGPQPNFSYFGYPYNVSVVPYAVLLN